MVNEDSSVSGLLPFQGDASVVYVLLLLINIFQILTDPCDIYEHQKIDYNPGLLKFLRIHISWDFPLHDYMINTNMQH